MPACRRNFAFVSSIVLEYKDTRGLLPAPLNILALLIVPVRKVYTMVTRQATRLKQSSKRNSTHPMNAASEFLHSTGGGGSGSDSTNTSGYTWPGGATTQVERLAEARRHRRKQQGMCGRHMRKVEEEASLSLDAQVHLITERQADMEAKQEQRLES